MKKEFPVVCMMSGRMSMTMGPVGYQEHRARCSHSFSLGMQILFCSEMSYLNETADSHLVRDRCLSLGGFTAVNFFITDHIQI